MSRREIVVDDLTGRESDNTEPIKVTFNGKSYTLDLTVESRDALMVLFTEHKSDALAKLLGYVNANKPGAGSGKRSGNKSSADGDTKLIREWWGTAEGRAATETPADMTIPNRGRIPEPVQAAYHSRNA
jgi:hypothetical protein